MTFHGPSWLSLDFILPSKTHSPRITKKQIKILIFIKIKKSKSNKEINKKENKKQDNV